MKTTDALLGGLAGAITLTLVHESLRRLVPDAPRMDLLGMQAIRKLLRNADQPVPTEKTLFTAAMAGDLVGNGLYYGVGGLAADRDVVSKSAFLGLTAGVGALLLPKPLGLSDAPSRRTTGTAVLTIALYTVGGLAAGIVMKALQARRCVAVPAGSLVL
ncbi:MAG: hypothetical protein JWP27_1900 [Flaviaesturariibacter sp.]|nr:hypothetical protein [Flaviaesturariibacter sp.]